MANPLCEVLIAETELKLPQAGPDTFAGAIVDFSGVVRGREGDREIDGIEYEAHLPMAEHQLKVIGQKSIEKFGLELVIIHHRIGFVPAGEPSLVMRVAGKHRSEAFQASQWIVDELKKRVPIWKHPRFKTDDRSPKKKTSFQKDLVSHG